MVSASSTSASSVWVLAFPIKTSAFIEPVEADGWAFASGVPIVRKDEERCGGLHDGNASGGPCVSPGVVQGVKAGTRDTRSGVAPLGRG